MLTYILKSQLKNRQSPFMKIHCLPLLAKNKLDGRFRIIVDLSWPLRASCVPSDVCNVASLQISGKISMVLLISTST